MGEQNNEGNIFITIGLGTEEERTFELCHAEELTCEEADKAKSGILSTILNDSIHVGFFMNCRPKRMTQKRFKKHLMSYGWNRNDAERFSKIASVPGGSYAVLHQWVMLTGLAFDRDPKRREAWRTYLEQRVRK